jgi:hypothetical protein
MEKHEEIIATLLGDLIEHNAIGVANAVIAQLK